MSLQVWLPLRGDLTNNGLAGDINIVNNSVTYNEQGKIGSCAYFNGSSFLSITSHKKAVSVCFWLKTTKKMQAIFVEPISKIAFGLNANLNMIVSCVNRNVPIYTNLDAIQDDTWTHITLVDIGTDVLLYINGNLETARGGNNYWIHQNNELLIGKRQASSDSFFTGYLNDFRIYDHALSQKQIKQIAKGLILHYKLDNDGYNEDNIIRDCSGYENDGQVIGEVLIDENSPRYGSSVKLKGSASSVIKVTDNKWMVQGADSITVNFWAKAVTWPTNGGRCVSCTQTGGFNLQAGSSGYWRFPVYVHTNSSKTSYAYKYDSKEIQISALTPNEWNMITLIYDSAGTRTYINGQLHHTYSNVSYGIRFNKNARLFLGCEANTANPYTPYFNGWLSDFRIYGTVLSDDDIRELYQVQSSVDRNNNIYAREIIEE